MLDKRLTGRKKEVKIEITKEKTNTYSVLSQLIWTLGGHVFGLQNEGSGGIGDGLCEAEEDVLPLLLDDLLFSDRVEDSVRGRSNLTGGRQHRLPRLLGLGLGGGQQVGEGSAEL